MEKYENLKKIYSNSYKIVYEGLNRHSNNLVIIKEINKNKKYSKHYKEEGTLLKSLNSDNIVSLIEEIETEDKYYIIMEKCMINLDDYLKIRIDPLSTDEIREILTQMNNALKIIKKKKVILANMKLTNILITLDRIDKLLIKLSNFEPEDKNSNSNSNDESFFHSPEFLNEGKYSEKNDIWKLGIIIYYICFKEFPFKGDSECEIFSEIEKGKINDFSDNELNDLIKKMLNKDEKKRISWEEYFNHSFFKKESPNKFMYFSPTLNLNTTDNSNTNTNNNILNNQNEKQFTKFPEFNLNCNLHNNKCFVAYCQNCKCNICSNCNEHFSHEIVPFNQIGVSKNEIYQIDVFLKGIENNINKMVKIKKEMIDFYSKLKSINTNTSIYNIDTKNNFKNPFIQCLKLLNEKLKFEGSFNMMNLLTGLTIKKQSKEMPLKNIKLSLKQTINYDIEINCISVFPSGNFVSASKDKKIKIYDSNYNLIQNITNGHNNNILSISIKDENNFVTSSADFNIITWKKENNKFIADIKIIKAHNDIIWKIMYYKNDNLISCGDGIKIWIRKNNKYENIKKLTHSLSVESMLLLEEKNILISSSSDGTKIWNLKNYDCQYIKEIKAIIGNTIVKLDNNKILFGGEGWGDTIMSVFDINEMKVIKKIDNEFDCKGILVIHKKNCFLTVGRSKDIRIYNLETLSLDNIIKNSHNEDEINGVVLFKDFTVGSYGKNIKVWSFA